MNLPDIIYRNNNYVENLHTTGNIENKDTIFIQQFHIPKQSTSYVRAFEICWNLMLKIIDFQQQLYLFFLNNRIISHGRLELPNLLTYLQIYLGYC